MTLTFAQWDKILLVFISQGYNQNKFVTLV